jgi:hypothetical protein
MPLMEHNATTYPGSFIHYRPNFILTLAAQHNRISSQYKPGTKTFGYTLYMYTTLGFIGMG